MYATVFTSVLLFPVVYTLPFILQSYQPSYFGSKTLQVHWKSQSYDPAQFLSIFLCEVL